MARHGENIRKRKDGRWEGRYAVFSEEKGKKIYRSVYADTYNGVRKKLELQKNLLKSEASGHTGQIEAHPILFSNTAKEWLSEVKCDKKISTYVKYRTVYKKHIEPLLQETAVSDVSCDLADMISGHLSESMKKSVYCVLNQIFKYASQKYGIEVPALKKYTFTVRKKPVQVLSKKEQEKLVSALNQKTDVYKMAVLLGLFTGLRLGELCALKWSDIDFGNKILMVRRTVQRLSTGSSGTVLVETAPKSEYSRREIPLPETAVTLLIKFRNKNEYIFGVDKPLEPRTLQYHFKKILKEANLQDKNFHMLRHTFSTNCIERGTDVKSLSELLGHSDVQITLNRYVHPSMETKRQYLNSLSQFYGQINGHGVLQDC